MLTVDFGTLATSGPGVADMVVVADFCNQDGELVTSYIDCVPMLPQHESKDWNYVRSALWQLETAGFFHGFTRIIWWSDTGPNHFRVSNTMWAFRNFQEQTGRHLEINFFCPYHGHSVCDGHLGAIARVIYVVEIALSPADIMQMLRKAACELVDTLTVWDKEFVQNTIENQQRRLCGCLWTERSWWWAVLQGSGTILSLTLILTS